MNRLIKLANEKNHYLEKFLTLNEEESQRLKLSNYDNLDNFYETREQILEIIKYIDSEMSAISGQSEEMKPTDEERKQFNQAMITKDEYVARILDQDLEVLASIEQAKIQIIHELRDINKNKKALGGYKTKVATEGRSLNEEC